MALIRSCSWIGVIKAEAWPTFEVEEKYKWWPFSEFIFCVFSNLNHLENFRERGELLKYFPDMVMGTTNTV